MIDMIFTTLLFHTFLSIFLFLVTRWFVHVLHRFYLDLGLVQEMLTGGSTAFLLIVLFITMISLLLRGNLYRMLVSRGVFCCFCYFGSEFFLRTLPIHSVSIQPLSFHFDLLLHLSNYTDDAHEQAPALYSTPSSHSCCPHIQCLTCMHRSHCSPDLLESLNRNSL